jgi:hypothetical protein
LEVAVRELHERLHHAASPAVMARALRFGAWLNVEMLPTDVERVFSHQSCLACVLGKTTETPEYEFGEAVYLGFKVVNPVSVSGHTGFYLFSERSSRLLFAVLTKTHDSANELWAIRMSIVSWRSGIAISKSLILETFLKKLKNQGFKEYL